MPLDILADVRPDFDRVIDHLKEDLMTLRTGRANPSVVEKVMVEAYGSRTELVGLASISVPDARSILIEPWDKSILKDIERGIQEAKLGINPVVQGNQVRISLPQMTEESRKALIKVMNEKLEQGRIAIRAVRDKAKGMITAVEKDGEINEDVKYRLLEQLDKMAAGCNERIKNVGAEKEKDIMTI